MNRTKSTHRHLLATAALCVILVPASVIAPAAPAAAQSEDDYASKLQELEAGMASLKAEIEAFQIPSDYCAGRQALKGAHSAQMTAFSQRARSLIDAAKYVSDGLEKSLANRSGARGRRAAKDGNLLDPDSYIRARNDLQQALKAKQDEYDAAARKKCSSTGGGGGGAISVDPPGGGGGKPKQEAPLPTPPTYQAVSFPALPQRLCSAAEKSDLLSSINVEIGKVGANKQAAAAFRTAVEAAINARVQADQPVPAALGVLKRRAFREFEEQSRKWAEIEAHYERAKAMAVVDCSTALKSDEAIGVGGGGSVEPVEDILSEIEEQEAAEKAPKEDILSEIEDPNEAKWRDRDAPRARMPSALDASIEAAVRKHEEARKRCDNQGMKAALAELRALYQEAQRLAADVQEAGEFSTVPLNDARDVRYRAEKALERAEMLSPSECLEPGAQYILDGPKVSYGESRLKQAARLAAIQQLRTGQAGASGTEVQFAFPGGSDLSGRTRADVENRVRDVEYVRKEERRQDTGGHSQPKETGQPLMPVERMPEPPVREPQAPPEEVERPWTPPEELEQIPSMPPQELERLPATPISSAPPPELERPSVATGSTMLLADVDAPTSTGMSSGPYSVRLPGTWRVANPSLGLRQVTIANQGSGVVLSGSGGAIRLERNGNSYVGSGSLMPGRSAQPIRLQVQGSQLQLLTRNDGGESVAATLVQ